MRKLEADTYKVMSSDFTVDTLTPLYFVNAADNNVTVTLLPLGQSAGQGKQFRVQVKRIDSSPNTVTVRPPDGVTMEGGNFTVEPMTSQTFFANMQGYWLQKGKSPDLSGYATISALSGYQPLDSDLSAIASLTTTSFGRSLLTMADGAAIRGLIGAGAGTVTSVGTGTGLTGGPITTTGTVALGNVGTPGTYSGITSDPQGRIVSGTNRSFNASPARSIVTVAAAANGFQPDSTRDVLVSYSLAITTTVSLTGNASGYVVLEISPTNSATASSWVETGRLTSGQSGTLVIGLVLTQVTGGSISAVIPAGYFARMRSVNVAGTPTYALNAQQEVKL